MPTTTAKRTSYRGKTLSIEQHDLVFESGIESTFELIKFHVVTGVSALPVTQNGTVLLIKQFQLGIDGEGLSLPTGGLPIGEDPAERMQLELQEELGIKAGRLTLMTRSLLIPSYVGTEPAYLYLAEDLSPAKLEGDEPFPISRVELSIEEALSQVHSGIITESRIQLALLYYQTFLRKK